MREGQTARIGRAEDFPVGQVKIVTVGRREIGVVRRADGTVHAVRNWCPHKGAPICKGQLSGTTLPGPPGTLTWGHDGEILRCPWHGFEFFIANGKTPYTGTNMRLRVYPARIDNGEIVVDLGAQRSSGTSEQSDGEEEAL